MNKLYFGDCLDIIRQYIDKESVDLIYLDPPFNSKRDYNLLFKSPKGHESEAQITAFEDSWHWGEQAEGEFSLILAQPNTDVAEVIQALRKFLGENDMMAYLTMMASRLLDLHCPQAHRQPLPPLRPHRQPLLEDRTGCGVREGIFQK